MNESLQKKEGLLLKLHPYRDQMEIATLFFPEEGLAEGLLHRNKFQSLGLTPPLKAEWIVKQSRGQLLFIQQVSPIDQYLHLRKSYNSLIGAGQILRATLATQNIGHSAPDLYRLCVSYLEDLGKGNPVAIAASYQLKTLRHEGWLNLLMPCLQCDKTPEAIGLTKEGVFCAHHPQRDMIIFDEEETQQIQLLAYATRKEWIYNLDISPSLAEKISSFFEKSCDR